MSYTIAVHLEPTEEFWQVGKGFLNNFKDISQDEIIEKKHILFSSLLLIIFGLIMITYLLFN